MASGAWPEDSDGPIAPKGRILLVQRAVEKTKVDNFPIALFPGDSGRPGRVDRDHFLDTVDPILTRIKVAIGSARQPEV